jgi:hypothetical protein
MAKIKSTKAQNTHKTTEHGRWINSQRENRKHHLCNLEIGDEFHYIVSCKKK